MKGGILVFTVLAMVLAFVGGCKVQVDKSRDGEQQNVKIATPFGGINVNQDQTTAAELGLAAYPGAVQDMTGEGSKSAKVDMGFGSWKLRVKVAHYATADRQDQVIAFYRNALSQYGTVIECEAHFDNSPNNRFNPDPTKEVHYGEQTWEEMMIGFFDVAVSMNTTAQDLMFPKRPGEQARK